MAKHLSPSIIKGFDKRWLLLVGCTLYLFLIYYHYSNPNRSNVQLETFFETIVHPPGVILIVHKKGGLGNQLFEYACSYALAKDLGWPLYLFFDGIDHRRNFKPRVREFVLDKFQINLDVFDITTKFSAKIRYLNDRTLFQRKFLDKHNSRYDHFFRVTSYCQSKEYWKNYEEEIQAMFQVNKSAVNFPKLEKIINKIITSEESVAVHVRRGDFLKIKGYFIPISYQRSAMRKMISILKERGKEKPVFFIFSDDISYAEKKLKDFAEDIELVFVTKEISGSTSIEDFYLMTLCKHIIIPNSSYSWWAAYLIKYKEKIVIASAHNPEFFSGQDDFFIELYRKLYYPKEWIVIDPFTVG